MVTLYVVFDEYFQSSVPLLSIGIAPQVNEADLQYQTQPQKTVVLFWGKKTLLSLIS